MGGGWRWEKATPFARGRDALTMAAALGGKALARLKRWARHKPKDLPGDWMNLHRLAHVALIGGVLISLSACGTGLASGDSGLFRRSSPSIPSEATAERRERAEAQRAALARASGEDQKRSTIWDLFSNASDPNTTVEVNKYLWQASLDVLSFLPIESVDPFTGVISTGYGTPPGGGRAYRATIYVQDPALEARSLKVALQSRGGGAVAPETQRAVEDAILTRARQLRIRDAGL